MKRFVMIITSVTLAGCDEPQVEQGPSPAAVVDRGDAHTNRFGVERFGEFRGGFGNHVREILVVHDRATGRDYLAITGCGATELWTETHRTGKQTHTRTVED